MAKVNTPHAEDVSSNKDQAVYYKQILGYSRHHAHINTMFNVILTNYQPQNYEKYLFISIKSALYTVFFEKFGTFFYFLFVL